MLRLTSAIRLSYRTDVGRDSSSIRSCWIVLRISITCSWSSCKAGGADKGVRNRQQVAEKPCAVAILRCGTHLVVLLQSRGELDVARKPATRTGQLCMKARPSSTRVGGVEGGRVDQCVRRTCCSARASAWRPGRVTCQGQSAQIRSPSRPRPLGLQRVHSRSRPLIGRHRPHRCFANPL